MVSPVKAIGEFAGPAVWLSFLLAGAVAALQGHSLAKFGTYYPSAGGLLAYDRGRYGNGHFTRDHCLAHSGRQRQRHPSRHKSS
jgi:L-asparagine transporter-like permease